MKIRIKGISPLIATVLLIAFTVGVAGIVSVWLTGFTKTSTESVEEQSTTQLTCVYGGVSLRNLKYANTNISGNIENTGQISLGKITIQVMYTNRSDVLEQKLCLFGTNVYNCTAANLTLSPREMKSFNVTSGTGAVGNIDKVRVFTNCSSVYDEADNSEITA